MSGLTHGEAYSTNHRGYRDKHERYSRNLTPIHAEVARLVAQGRTMEQAWTEVMRRVAS